LNRRKFIENSLGLILVGTTAPSLLLKGNNLSSKDRINYPFYTPNPEQWNNDEINMAWIGHSTVLININGKIILTDPVLFNSIGLYLLGTTIGKTRATLPALEFDEMPKPDIVLLSHSHMDHMDYKSLKELTDKFPNDINCVTAFNTKDIINDLKWNTLRELDWDKTINFGELRMKAIEVNHDSFRIPGERDRADGDVLDGRSYNGYILESNGKKILFAGDTAYTDTFTQYKNENIDVAIMPIGGYVPHHHRHCNPEEALIMASEHMEAQYFVPMHCNTFDGNEGFHTPIDWMMSSASTYKIKIGLSEIGETLTIKS
jgi:L-ascorbate metabolism protein UlaG (beta-lactamase superfamily)